MQLDTDGDGTADTSLVALISEDISNIRGVLPNAGLGEDNDLYQVLSASTQGPGSIDYDGDSVIESTDISGYLKNVLGK